MNANTTILRLFRPLIGFLIMLSVMIWILASDVPMPFSYLICMIT
jgi:hypothetical protein